VAAARGAGSLALALALLTGGGAARAAGPTPTSPPTITGIAAAGNRLQAASGTWASSSPVDYRYQWYRCDESGGRCASIRGASAAGFQLSKNDVGETIGLKVVASDEAGSTIGYAGIVGPIAAPKPLLVSTAQPQVTGLPVEGQTLQVTAGAWSPAPTIVGYMWQRCNAHGRACVPIPHADAGAYTIVGADIGHALAAVVRASFGTTTQLAFSSATAPAVAGDAAGPTPELAPAVTGVLQLGARLTGSTGTWSGIGPLTYAYQWHRCDDSGAHCSSIHGATKATYRSVSKDVGKLLGLTVRATDSTGTAPAYASLVGPVAPSKAAVASSGQPTQTGLVKRGSTLTVGAGEWTPQAGQLVYAWNRCNANGRVCTPVPGATGSSYAITPADRGHTLVAVVSTTLGATTQSAWSSASRPVP
jgi:hypothetical protein